MPLPVTLSIASVALAAMLGGWGPSQDQMDSMESQDAMRDGGMMTPAEEFDQNDVLFFESKIRPLLISACSGCHSDSGSRIRAGFEIDTRAAMVRGGDSGAGIVPGDPDVSLLIQAVRYDDPFLQMPPRGKLSPDGQSGALLR